MLLLWHHRQQTMWMIASDEWRLSASAGYSASAGTLAHPKSRVDRAAGLLRASLLRTVRVVPCAHAWAMCMLSPRAWHQSVTASCACTWPDGRSSDRCARASRVCTARGEHVTVNTCNNYIWTIKPYKESLSPSGSPASDRRRPCARRAPVLRLYGVRHARSNSHCRRLARRGQPVRRHVTRRRLARGRGWLEGRRRQRATAVASGAHTAVIEHFEHIDSYDSDSARARQLVRRQLARPRARRCMRRQRKRPLVRLARRGGRRACAQCAHARATRTLVCVHAHTHAV